MTKRILLALTLAGALGGGILACNTPAATTTPIGSGTAPAASTPASSPAGSVETPSESPAESMSAEPSAS